MPDLTSNYRVFLDYVAFFVNFHTLINIHYSCLEYFIFTKFSQAVCLTIWYVDMTEVTAGYERQFDLNAFFR